MNFQFITAYLDSELLHEEYGSEILNSLRAAQIEYKIQSHVIPRCISWSRKVQTHLIHDDGKVIISIILVHI